MFMIREVHPRDLDQLETLAVHLNTVNLPADRDRLARLIDHSRKSFGDELPHSEREYVFGMTTGEGLIGTAMIIAQHGTFERPAVYFNILPEQKYSRTLQKYFVHQVLQLSFTFDGATEIGGLILDPSYQGHPMKLGKILSFSRFLYIGMFRDRFRDQIIAELLPQLNDDGSSALWECLGANFTELSYREADQLSRENVEFIRSLFPQTPIYTALLPEEVREKIGVVGAPTRPVEKMLRDLGFEWDRSIDPFDGGPTFVCKTEDCRMVQRTHWVKVAGALTEGEIGEGRALVGSDKAFDEIRFREVLTGYQRIPNGYLFEEEALQALGVAPGDSVGILPLSGKDIEDFHRVSVDEGLWKQC